MCHCLPQGTILMTCTISWLRKEKKCMFVFPKLTLAWQGFIGVRQKRDNTIADTLEVLLCTNPLIWHCDYRSAGPQFNIKISSYQYRKSHFGDKMVVRSFYLHNRISCTGKMTSSYWIRVQIIWLPSHNGIKDVCSIPANILLCAENHNAQT